jgi:hypothetical protein
LTEEGEAEAQTVEEAVVTVQTAEEVQAILASVGMMAMLIVLE